MSSGANNRPRSYFLAESPLAAGDLTQKGKEIPFVLEGTSGAPMLHVSDFTAS